MPLKFEICPILFGVLLVPAFGNSLVDSNMDVESAMSLTLGEREADLDTLYGVLDAIPTPLKNGMADFLAVLNRIITKVENSTNEVMQVKKRQQCTNAVRAVISDALKQEPYANKLFDSWGTPELGLLEANWRWPGHYYQCWTAEGEAASGKWCNAYLGRRYEPYWLGYPPSISLGSCFPRVCSERSVKTILQELYDDPPLQGVDCPLPPTHLSTRVIICIVISSLLVTCVLLASAFEKYQKMRSGGECKDERNTKRKICGKVLCCFSAISNCEQILNMKKVPGAIPVLDGIRFLSTTWIILFHTYFLLPYLLDNTTQAERVIRGSAWSMALVNGVFAVDTFFFLSGLLVTYLGIKQLNKSNGHMNVPLMYLRRYVRLTPAYAYLILFSVGLFTYFGNGPYWKLFSGSFYNKCKNQWFSNLLYINTLYPATSTCIEWGWYLADDMQFYILSPIFLFALYKKRKVGIALMCAVCAGSMLITGILTYVNNLQTSAYNDLASWIPFTTNTSGKYDYHQKFTTDIYTTPWCRISVYMIGMLTGYMLNETNMKIKMHKAVALSGWLVIGSMACAVIYGPFGTAVKEAKPLSKELSTLYETFARPTWGVCLAWVVTACVSGYGGPIRKFLDWSVFTPLARMTYSAYLVHILVLYWYIGSQEKPIHYQTTNLTFIYLGTVVLSFGCGFILLLLVEWPFIRLGKLVFRSKRDLEKTRSSAKLENEEMDHLDQNPTNTIGNVETKTVSQKETDDAVL